MDTLFEIEPTTPKWRELADLHGITFGPVNQSPDIEFESEYRIPESVAVIENFGEYEHEYADNDREAVITLIHRLQLEGWKTVSL